MLIIQVLIYVFDVESRELEKDLHYYQSCLEAILQVLAYLYPVPHFNCPIQNSPDAKIFCLVHKMDLVQEDQREVIFSEREEDLKKLSKPLDCTCFRTSIWDETLYKAWSSIVDAPGLDQSAMVERFENKYDAFILDAHPNELADIDPHAFHEFLTKSEKKAPGLDGWRPTSGERPLLRVPH